MRIARSALVAAIVAALMAALTLFGSTPAVSADRSVNLAGQTRSLTGTNIPRVADALVEYTPTHGSSTRTNAYGFEAAVVGTTVVRVQDGVGDMTIPSDGFVVSGHGAARAWLRSHATVGATLTIGTAPPASTPASWVSIRDVARALTGTDVVRPPDGLIRYTSAYGASTRTNPYGFEAAVVDGRVTQIENGVGDMAIPSGGYVLSGHGQARKWLQINAVVGAPVSLSQSAPTNGGSKLPDVGIRTLRNFSIVVSGGRRMLKFPVVTVNVGNGPIEIRASRSSSTSTDWVGRQVLHNADGTTTSLPTTSAQFYYGADGHNHFHIRDFDSYELLDTDGTTLRLGEKHGFCFEDNTGYRDWAGSPNHPEVPTSPVYTHTGSCGQGNPQATIIVLGLSVGWADTYPATLPDQGIDITGLPDGTYVVKVTADWQHYWRETNEANNSASARISISGNTVSLLSASDGL